MLWEGCVTVGKSSRLRQKEGAGPGDEVITHPGIQAHPFPEGHFNMLPCVFYKFIQKAVSFILPIEWLLYTAFICGSPEYLQVLINETERKRS